MPSNSKREEFGREIKEFTINSIKSALSKVNSTIACKYTIFYMMVLAIILFSWYYIVTFASIYKMSSLGWIYSSVITIIADMLIVELIIIPLILSISRSIAKSCQGMG